MIHATPIDPRPGGAKGKIRFARRHEGHEGDEGVGEARSAATIGTVQVPSVIELSLGRAVTFSRPFDAACGVAQDRLRAFV